MPLTGAVAELRADPSFESENEHIIAFINRGGSWKLNCLL